jgi:hypothetical protein
VSKYSFKVIIPLCRARHTIGARGWLRVSKVPWPRRVDPTAVNPIDTRHETSSQIQSSNRDFVPLCGFLLPCLNPNASFFILLVNGEADSAKSTLCRSVRALVDPNKAELRSQPKDNRDLEIGGDAGVGGLVEELVDLGGLVGGERAPAGGGEEFRRPGTCGGGQARFPVIGIAGGIEPENRRQVGIVGVPRLGHGRHRSLGRDRRRRIVLPLRLVVAVVLDGGFPPGSARRLRLAGGSSLSRHASPPDHTRSTRTAATTGLKPKHNDDRPGGRGAAVGDRIGGHSSKHWARAR